MGIQSRRKFLTATFASAGVLSGCNIIDSNQEASLGGIRLVNATDKTGQFHFVLEVDDEITMWSSHELDPAPGNHSTSQSMTPKGTGDADSIVLHCRIGNEQVRYNLDDWDSNGCVAVAIIWRQTDLLKTTVTPVKHLEDPDPTIDCP